MVIWHFGLCLLPRIPGALSHVNTMAPRSRHNISSSRRKRGDEEGEDEGSFSGAMEGVLSSEGSIISRQDDEDADGEGSEESEDDASVSPQAESSGSHQINGPVHRAGDRLTSDSASPVKRQITAVSDTEATLNGSIEKSQTYSDNMRVKSDSTVKRTPSAPPSEPNRDTFSDRKRREHERYVKERDENPAFVPTRGSFFLHDKRSTGKESGGYDGSIGKFNKSKPYGLIVDGNMRRYGNEQMSRKSKEENNVNNIRLC